MNKILVLFLVFMLTCEVFAQDIHWSQFTENQLYLSPANSGNFEGTTRLSALYRDQWRSVTKPFQSFAFNFDKRWEKNENFGLGFYFLNDVSGDGKFKTIELNVMPSYTKLLKKDSSQSIRSGLQIGFNHRQFTFPNFYFDEQYNGISYDPNSPITENLITDKKNNLTLGAGVVYEFRTKKKSTHKFGFSAYNLNQANQGFYGEKVKRDPRLLFFTIHQFKLGEKSILIPSFLFQSQGTYREIVIGSQVRYTLRNESKNYKAIYGGLFLRNQEAIYLNLGLNLNKFQIGLSYDINISSLKPASAAKGGFEISLIYIFSKFKAKQIQHRICPEFI